MLIPTDPISWVFCGLILLFFLIAVALLFVSRSESKRELKLLRKDTLPKSASLRKVYEAYKGTFTTVNVCGEGAERKQTRQSAHTYFQTSAVLKSTFFLPTLLAAMPSTLLAIGILGTFVGLTSGLSSFETANTEQIQLSIEALLDGMSTAFLTSIYGLLLSAVLTLLERYLLADLRADVERTNYALDREHMLTRNDEARLLAEEQDQRLQAVAQTIVVSMRELFSATAEDHNGQETIITPGNALRDLRHDSREQTVALKSFSTDLAESIENNFMDPDNERSLASMLERLTNEVRSLAQSLATPAEDMTKSIVEDLKSALAEMLNTLKTDISGSAKDELETLTAQMGVAGSSLASLPDNMLVMSERLEASFLTMTSLVEELRTGMTASANAATQRLDERVDSVTGRLEQPFDRIIDRQREMAEAFTGQVVQSARISESLTSSIIELDKLAKSTGEAAGEFTSASRSFRDTETSLTAAGRSMSQTAETMDELQKRLALVTDSTINKQSASLDKLQETLSEAKRLSMNTTEDFTTIREGIGAIISQLTKELSLYTTHTADVTGKFQREFSDGFVTGLEALSSSTKELSDLADDLVRAQSK